MEVVSARAVALLGLIRSAGAVSASASAPVVSVVLEAGAGRIHAPDLPASPGRDPVLLDPVVDALDRARPLVRC